MIMHPTRQEEDYHGTSMKNKCVNHKAVSTAIFSIALPEIS